MSIKTLLKTLPLLLILLISSCGWQLKGQRQAPAALKVLTLQHQLGPAASKQLQQQLTEHGWLITTDAASSQALLSLNPLDIRSRTQTINSQGQVAEYELVGRLSGSLVSANGSTTPIDITTQVWFDNDVTRVSATELEETAQRARLTSKLIDLLILRLLHSNSGS
ncbi:LPS assembly lipoprotein LptE [Oceanobacter mangrovi]|uniref:LPS-assembly lipoprotein LptE n=1 Tax=Oceanobacter mangrovi TaxID=2862510 RepID=UPI001C8E1E03|nr:LPS assembly lipoprotein LptE [Oceanobacter mangrovi]